MDGTTVQERDQVKIPTTAKEQMRIARELGHVLAVQQRGPWPELNDPHPKFYVSCSCGYKAAASRSRVAARSTVTWHMGKVLADYFENPQRVNGA